MEKDPKVKTDRLSSLFWLAIGLGAVGGSFHLGLGTLREPGSGLLSFLGGVSLSLMAVILFLTSFLREKENPSGISALWEGVRWHRAVIVVFALLAYILFLERIGFILISWLVIFVLLKGLEKYSWRMAGLIALLASTLAYLIFSVSLKVMLPRGLLWF